MIKRVIILILVSLMLFTAFISCNYNYESIFSMGDQLYFIVGELNITAKKDTYSVLFNKN